MNRIPITPLTLENQRPTDDPNHCYLEITPNYILSYLSFWAEEPKNNDDKMMGWERVYNHFETYAMRDNIAGVEKQWMPKAKKWGVYIMVNGFASDIKIFFKKESEATELLSTIVQWLDQ